MMNWNLSQPYSVYSTTTLISVRYEWRCLYEVDQAQLWVISGTLQDYLANKLTENNVLFWSVICILYCFIIIMSHFARIYSGLRIVHHVWPDMIMISNEWHICTEMCIRHILIEWNCHIWLVIVVNNDEGS